MKGNFPLALHSLIGWKQAFTILGMERCAPFFEAMGLPQMIVAEPGKLATRARDYLSRTVAATNPDDRAQKQTLADVFSQIASDYDRGSADALYAWCLKYIVNDDTAVEMSVWRDLFRRLCGVVTSDELSCPPLLTNDAISHICRIIRPDFEVEFMKYIRQQLQTARALPNSEWEDWLEKETHQVAGQGEILGAVEMALDLVENIVANVRTCEALARLKSQLSPGQKADLFAWATRQATALGIPGNLIHDLDDQSPERPNLRG